eukprot:810940_1
MSSIGRSEGSSGQIPDRDVVMSEGSSAAQNAAEERATVELRLKMALEEMKELGKAVQLRKEAAERERFRSNSLQADQAADQTERYSAMWSGRGVGGSTAVWIQKTINSSVERRTDRYALYREIGRKILE